MNLKLLLMKALWKWFKKIAQINNLIKKLMKRLRMSLGKMFRMILRNRKEKNRESKKKQVILNLILKMTWTPRNNKLLINLNLKWKMKSQLRKKMKSNKQFGNQISKINYQSQFKWKQRRKSVLFWTKCLKVTSTLCSKNYQLCCKMVFKEN